jgi:hypothetical protein
MKLGDIVYYYKTEDKTIHEGLVTGMLLRENGYELVLIRTEKGETYNCERELCGTNKQSVECRKNMLDGLVDTINARNNSRNEIIKKLNKEYKSKVEKETFSLTAEIDNLRIDVIGQPTLLKKLNDFNKEKGLENGKK